jgi:hypothetical protein
MWVKLNYYVKRFSVFLIMAALIAGMVGCDYNPPPIQKLEIRTWYDLDAVRSNLDGSYILMNNLDSTTPGYEELASRTANGGNGWEPIGYGAWGFTYFGVKEIGELFKGILDGQGYEIRDLYINNEDQVGLFGFVAKGGILSQGGIIKNLTLINATVTADAAAGNPAGLHEYTARCLDVGPAAGGVGGLVGYNRGTVSNCYAIANVTGDWNVGGLVGRNDGTVSNCYATGTVTGRGSVGGLVGDSHEGTVSESYSISSVSGNSSVGGLVGSHYDATVKKCYSAGSVAGTSSVGGLVGHNLEGTVSDSFWDIETSRQSASAGGTGKTTAELKNVATFSGAGWNITAVANAGTRNHSYIWNIVNGVTYPFLSWQAV